MKEYSWTTGGFNYKQDPNEVGKELEKLGDELTPKNIVNLARNENSVLHEMFEWDDTVAAEQYRKQQANLIIQNLKITVIADDNTERKVKAFVTVKRNTVFEPIEKVVKDVDKYSLLLDKAYKELNGIKIKYRELQEIQDLLSDIPV
jgi:hypothetical protein